MNGFTQLNVLRPATHRKTEKGRQLADGREEGMGEDPNHTTA
jgi:hypothetical protein